MREHGDVVPLLWVPLGSAGIRLPPKALSPPGWRPAGPRRPRGRQP
jgi:hypothetical protein